MSKKMKIVVSVLVWIFVLITTAAISYHVIEYPFKALSANIEIRQLSNEDLKYYVNYLDKYRNDDGSFEYLNEHFEIDLSVPNEYCAVKVIVEFKNTSSIMGMTPEYLIPRSDNDVIGFSVASLKYFGFDPGEIGDVTCEFICRRNGMTDEELRDYIFGLNYYFVQYDGDLGEKQSKLSLKKFA